MQQGGDSQSQTDSAAWLKVSDVELGVILNKVGELQPIFQVEGDHLHSPATAVGNQNTRKVPLSYGADILTDNYFVLSQCMRLTDEQTKRR